MSKHHHHHKASAGDAREHSIANGSQDSSSAGGSLQEEISQEAYGIYLDEGRPEGHALAHWFTAEAVVQGRRPNA